MKVDSSVGKGTSGMDKFDSVYPHRFCTLFRGRVVLDLF